MIDARRLSFMALLALLGVAFLPGCCGAKCASSATFAFQTPVAGQQFDIMVTNGDATRARMTTCEVAPTGTSCGYAPPLFVTLDAQGRLVGIATAIVSGGGGNVGIGFSVPINMARMVMERIM